MMKRVILWVVLGHVVFLILLVTDPWIPKDPLPKTKLVVTTLTLKPDPPIIRKVDPPKQVVPPKEKKAPPPKKRIAQKKTEKTPEKKEIADAIDSKAIAKAKESLAKIKQSPKSDEIAFTEDFRLEIARTLQEAIQLPEKGDVVLSLHLDKSGKVLSLEILQSQSQVNQNYVEQRVPKLSFPPFAKKLSSQGSKTFTITLTSD